MPKHVRNFWVEVESDVRKKPIGTGPTAADGGISIDVFIRDDGEVAGAGRLIGECVGDTLILSWRRPGGETTELARTKR